MYCLLTYNHIAYIHKHDKCPVLYDRPLGYKRVDLPLHKVADPPFHVQRDVFSIYLSYLYISV